MVGPGLGDRRVVQGELTEGHTGLARGQGQGEPSRPREQRAWLSTRCLGFRWGAGLCHLVRGEAAVGSGAYRDHCLWDAGWESVRTKQRVTWQWNEWIFPRERGRAEQEV